MFDKQRNNIHILSLRSEETKNKSRNSWETETFDELFAIILCDTGFELLTSVRWLNGTNFVEFHFGEILYFHFNLLQRFAHSSSWFTYVRVEKCNDRPNLCGKLMTPLHIVWLVASEIFNLQTSRTTIVHAKQSSLLWPPPKSSVNGQMDQWRTAQKNGKPRALTCLWEINEKL